jgi:hypothetical protein
VPDLATRWSRPDAALAPSNETASAANTNAPEFDCPLVRLPPGRLVRQELWILDAISFRPSAAGRQRT